MESVKGFLEVLEGAAKPFPVNKILDLKSIFGGYFCNPALAALKSPILPKRPTPLLLLFWKRLENKGIVFYFCSVLAGSDDWSVFDFGTGPSESFLTSTMLHISWVTLSKLCWWRWVGCWLWLPQCIRVFFNQLAVLLIFSRSLAKLIYTNNIESNVNINCQYQH